jgi:alpha-ribazole phosphatase/probable phosphoglycerate mutase
VPTAPLTARGRQQALAAAQTLAAEPITRIYTSTALRARQTAAILAATPGPPITAMPELVEARCTADVLRAWVVERDLGRRAADGETGHQVVGRVTAALQLRCAGGLAAAAMSGIAAIAPRQAPATMRFSNRCRGQ